MRAKYYVEYWALRLVFLVVNFLPYRLALVTTWPIAWTVHWVFRFRTRLARERIREVFPEYPAKRIRQIAWISFRNTVFNAVEMMRADRLTADWMAVHVDASTAIDAAKRHLGERPVIFAVLHMGNWDLAGQAVELNGLPSFFIMRRQRNPLTSDLLNVGRTAHGSEVLERDDPNMVRKAVRKLKDGRTMAILIDLRARTEALSLDFLGHKANIAGGLGVMARLSNAAVVPCRVIRKGWWRHEAVALDEILVDRSADKGAEIERITQRALDLLGEQVMQYPEQYFWYNKRWVLEPIKVSKELP